MHECCQHSFRGCRSGRSGCRCSDHMSYTATSRFAWPLSQKEASSEAGSQKSLQTIFWTQPGQAHELLEPCPAVWWVYGKLVWLRWHPACVATPWWGVPRKLCLVYSQAWWWYHHGLGLHEYCLVLGRCGSLRETWIPTCTLTFWSRRWCPPFRNCFPTSPPQTHHQDDNSLVAEGEGDGVAKYVSRPEPYWAHVGHPQAGRWRSTMCLTSSSFMMSLWRSGRGYQQQPVQLWWIACPGGLRQC